MTRAEYVAAIKAEDPTVSEADIQELVADAVASGDVELEPVQKEARTIAAREDNRPNTNAVPTDVTANVPRYIVPTDRSVGGYATDAARLGAQVFFPSTLRTAEEAGNDDVTMQSIASGGLEGLINASPIVGKMAFAGKGFLPALGRLGVESALIGEASAGAEALGGRDPLAGLIGGAIAPGLGRAVGVPLGLLGREGSRGVANKVMRDQRTGLPTDVLTKWSLAPEAEREFVRTQARQRADVGGELLQAANNPPMQAEKEAVEEILPSLGYFDLRGPIAAMRASVPPEARASAEGAASLADIEKRIAILKDWGRKRAEKANKRIAGQRGNHPMDEWYEIPATDALALRRELDRTTAHVEGVDMGLVNDAKKAAGNVVRRDLVAAADATGQPGWSEAMNSMHDKLDARSDVKRLFSKGDLQTQERSAERMAGGLMNQNRSWDRDAVSNFDKVFGTDFLRRIEAGKMADQLGVGYRPGMVEGGKLGEVFEANPREFAGGNPNSGWNLWDNFLRSPNSVTSTFRGISDYNKTPLPMVADVLSIAGEKAARGVAREQLNEKLAGAEQRFAALVAGLQNRNPLQQQGGYFD